MKTNNDSIKTFSYNGYTLDLFMDISNNYKYGITVFTEQDGTFYLHSFDDIYRAINVFDMYKMDLLKRGLTGPREAAKQ
jgi:hypothetical protein